MAKYFKLTINLMSLPGHQNSIVYTFAEIEKIIEGTLPAKAITRPSWWNNKKQQPQSSHCRAWLKAGFKADKLPNQQVKFSR